MVIFDKIRFKGKSKLTLGKANKEKEKVESGEKGLNKN